MDNSDDICKLLLKNISKRFPGVQALKDVSIDVKRGTVHAICGENGAGKSTIMKILNGSVQMDAGEIWIDGEKVELNSPKDAAEHGIAMIWQELQYVPYLSVEENMHLNRLPKKHGFVDWRAVRVNTEELLKREGINIPPDKTLSELSISNIQLLEIVKAISANAQIIIMDEPTSSLTQYETEQLLQKILRMKDEGRTILYISHKMDEIFRISDYVSIMRDGHLVSTLPISELDQNKIISMMVGREIKDIYPKRERKIGELLLEVKGLNRAGIYQDINFNVRKGEIVGFAGLVGAGRTEIMRSLFNLDPMDSGTVTLEGKQVSRSVSGAIRDGLMMATEDRRLYGLINVRSVKENISLASLARLCKGPFIDGKRENAECQVYFKRMSVKAPSMDSVAYSLSGGNQQKVVLAKWMMAHPKVLIMDEPTRGIDVGAKHDIYDLMGEIVSAGSAIIMVASELPELLGMCDRIYVIHEGRLTGEVTREEFSQELIMKYATGGN